MPGGERGGVEQQRDLGVLHPGPQRPGRGGRDAEGRDDLSRVHGGPGDVDGAGHRVAVEERPADGVHPPVGGQRPVVGVDDAQAGGRQHCRRDDRHPGQDHEVCSPKGRRGLVPVPRRDPGP